MKLEIEIPDELYQMLVRGAAAFHKPFDEYVRGCLERQPIRIPDRQVILDAARRLASGEFNDPSEPDDSDEFVRRIESNRHPSLWAHQPDLTEDNR